MWPAVPAITSFITFILACAGLVHGQEPPLFRAGVALVRVDAQVLDRQGRAIENLNAEDFEVFDQNAPQRITYFGREREPLDLVLLLDVSGSMKRSLEELGRVGRSALAQLRPGDRVGVMVFARNSKVRQKLSADLGGAEAQLRRAAEAVKDGSLGSGTAVNEAVIAAALYLREEERKGRRAILIATDSSDLNYQTPDEAVLRELYGSDAVLNGILIGRRERRQPSKPGESFNPDFTPTDVFRLAEESGGEALESPQAGRSFGEMIERIRARYSLEYAAPPGPPGFREVRVELAPGARARHPGAVVRARAGYYAGP